MSRYDHRFADHLTAGFKAQSFGGRIESG